MSVFYLKCYDARHEGAQNAYEKVITSEKQPPVALHQTP